MKPAMRSPLLAMLALSMGCFIPVAQSNGEPDAGDDAGAVAGGAGGGSGGGGAMGGGAGGSDAGTGGTGGGPAPLFDGGRGYCSGLIDGGWRMTWSGKTNDLTGHDAGFVSYAQWANAVWGTSPTDVWAVGGDTASGNFDGLILHWDGSSWTQVPAAGAPLLWAVWGSGPNDVWAVGMGGTILHFDGTAWTKKASGTTRGLNDVWGTGPNNVFAVGGGAAQPPDGSMMLHWNGTAWSPVVLPLSQPDTGRSLEGIHGTGPNDLWSVGRRGTVFHFDGAGWSVKNPGVPPRELLGVWALSPTDVWASADYGTLLHWDGTTWTPGPFQTSGVMFSVWGQQSNDVWSSDGTNCMRWDGTSWKRSTWGLGGPMEAEIRTVWGTGPNDLWAVGSQILHYP